METEHKELMVALDIGTTRILTMVAENGADGMEIIGWDRKDSRGLRDGMIMDIDATVTAINQTIEMVQRQADCEIKNVWATISGNHIESKQSHGLVSIKDNEVSQHDIDRVIELAKTVQMPPGKEILHTLIQEFRLDSEGGIRTPLGMSGVRLEAKVHFIAGGMNPTQNLLRCIRRCGLEVEDLYFSPLASAESVLTHDERDLGVCLIDMGGGTTDFLVYKNHAVLHSGVIPMAGNSITNDIAVGLRTSLLEAEDIKRRFGKAVASLADPEMLFEVSSNSEKNGRMESAQRLAAVIEPRATEILTRVGEQLRAAHVDTETTSIVITGGGSLLYGIEDLSEHLLQRPTRVGVPMVQGKLSDMVRNPNCAAAVGLLMLAQQNRRLTSEYAISTGGWGGWVSRVRDWVAQNF